jgi:hypothetical protein
VSTEPVPSRTDGPVLPWSAGLARHLDRRRFLRRGAEGVFAGVTAVAMGHISLGSFLRSLPKLTGLPTDCESCTGCDTYACCGPSPACGGSCCGDNCCSGGLGSHICKNSSGYCSPYNDWSGQNCWSHTTCSFGCCYVTVCCDCQSNCSVDSRCGTDYDINGVCICNSRGKFCSSGPDKGWSLWDPKAGRWVRVHGNPYAVAA